MNKTDEIASDRYVVTAEIGPYTFQFATVADNPNHAEDEVRTFIYATGGSTAGVTMTVEPDSK